GSRLDESPHALLEKERIALRARDQESAERIEHRIRPEQRVKERLGTLGGQGIDTNLCVERLSAPGMLILGPLVDEDQDACGRQALEQVIEKRLCLAVDPVEVFEDQEQGLNAALG